MDTEKLVASLVEEADEKKLQTKTVKRNVQGQ